MQKAQQKAIVDAHHKLTVLLLERGLYSPIELQFPLPVCVDAWEILPEVLNVPCDLCTGVPTTSWRILDRSHDQCMYECISCKKESVKYYLRVTPLEATELRFPVRQVVSTRAEVEKVGQVPAWIAPVPALLKKALGEEGVQHYRQGASSLRAGRGIGAAAYFRRIVEDHVDDLLTVVEEAAAAQSDQPTVERIRAAKGLLQATERLKIAKENTPAILRPGGYNPLGTLYEILSEGLHEKSDAENGIIASRAQKALAFFFETWASYRERSKEYTYEIAKQATKTT